MLLAQVWKWSNLSQQHPTCRNTVAKRTQLVAPNNVAICCIHMLRSFPRGFTKNFIELSFHVFLTFENSCGKILQFQASFVKRIVYFYSTYKRSRDYSDSFFFIISFSFFIFSISSKVLITVVKVRFFGINTFWPLSELIKPSPSGLG